MRVYLILAALAACCQTIRAVNIDPLPDCIKDCMCENSSHFNIEKKKAKHICGVKSGASNMWNPVQTGSALAIETVPSGKHIGNGIMIFAKVAYKQRTRREGSKGENKCSARDFCTIPYQAGTSIFAASVNVEAGEAVNLGCAMC